MGTADITRRLFQPGKYYAGLRLQQGRVLTDADFNEQQMLNREDRRRTLNDTIGPVGTIGAGFEISAPIVVSVDGEERLDFAIHAGEYYLAGDRFALESDQSFRFQRAWLQQRAEDMLLVPDLAPGESQVDLVFIHGSEEEVTGAEDAEIVEVALEGRDSGVRVRRSARVETMADVGSTVCGEAWATARARIEQATGYEFGPDGTELQPPADFGLGFLLEFGLIGLGCPPCDEDPQGQYLSAEHRAVRFMKTRADNRVTWGFDNAAPLYRVEALIGSTTITFDTLPLDDAHYPRAGQVVEVLPWAALLPNGEKVAGRTGVMASVAQGLDPGTLTLELTQPLPPELVDSWPASHPDSGQLPGPDGLYFFLRVWDRGAAEGAGLAPELLATAPSGVRHSLPGTSLAARFTPGSTVPGLPGDFWVASLRPQTPRPVTPWAFLDGGVPAQGPRRLLAPLALVVWRNDGAGAVAETIIDCRTPFTPLVGSAGCCTHTVGGSGGPCQGNYPNIQAAIDALPEDGGRVCVLPGIYTERFKIVGRHNVTVEGCGPRTVLETPQDNSNEPVVFICDAVRAVVRDFNIFARGVTGVQVRQLGETPIIVEARTERSVRAGFGSDFGAPRTRLLNIGVVCAEGVQGSPKNAIGAIGASGLLIEKCRALTSGDTASLYPLVYLSGMGIELRGCTLDARAQQTPRSWGGVHVGADASEVLIVDNLIRGGFGHGITLGEIAFEPQGSIRGQVTELIRVPVGCVSMFFPSETGAPQYSPFPLSPFSGLGAPLPVSAGFVSGVSIRDNRIDAPGTSGIASATFFQNEGVGISDAIFLDDIEIAGNSIRGFAASKVVPITESLGLRAFAVAGIAMPAVVGLEVENNCIEDAAPRRASCGVWVLFGAGVRVRNNQIRGLASQGNIEDHRRGGIIVEAAGPPIGVGLVDDSGGSSRLELLDASVAISGNRVEPDLGPALVVAAFAGPVHIDDNFFAGIGDPQPVPELVEIRLVVQAAVADSAGGAVVSVSNGGSAYDLSSNPSLTNDGRLLFTNNQVRLDWNFQGVDERRPVACSALLVGGDDLRVVGNQFEANMHQGPIDNDSSWWDDINNGALMATSLLASHVVVGGATVSLLENRITEGVTDAVISGLVLTSDWSAFSSLNDSTHCIVTDAFPGVGGTPLLSRNDHELINETIPATGATTCDPGSVCITNPMTLGTDTIVVELGCPPPPISS